ncbi:MAG: stage III sporulation protein AF [Caldicoprobacterales bacterium]|nr:stage III sporulation protein AF [Clostridiales bacterium]
MIKQWILNIIAVVVLGTLLDMVIPSGNIKKYTKFFIGLISILAILQPIIKMTGNIPQLTKDIWIRQLDAELETMSIESKDLEKSQEKYLLELYKSRLEEDIINRLNQYVPDSEVLVIATLEKVEGQEMFLLSRIDINIGPSKQVNIEPVEIIVGDRLSEGGSFNSQINNQEVDKNFETIKEYISNTYEIDKSRIYINKK